MKKLFTLLFSVCLVAFQAVQAQDLVISSVVSPVTGCGLTSPAPVTIIVNNLSPAGAYGGISAVYDYSFSDGGTAIPFTGGFDYDGSIDVEQGTPVTFTFTDYMDVSIPGTYTLTITVFFPNEVNTANNTIVYTFTNHGPPIVVSPAAPYLQTFEANDYRWAPGGVNSSWALGTPAGTIINAPYAGTRSWVTNLTGSYNNNEASYVQSPCFNFTNVVDPFIEMGVWWTSQHSVDGAVLMYSTNGGQTWLRIGSVSDTLNWYNDNTIDALQAPTGQQHGWTGLTTNSSQGWKLARHSLRAANGNSLGGLPMVQFRIYFASNGTIVNEGFAFDNVSIRDMPRNELALVSLVPFPQGCGLGTSQAITVAIRNNGSTPQPAGSFNLSYSIDGNPVAVNVPYQGPTIAPYTTVQYTFPAPYTYNLTTAAQFAFTASLSLPLDENLNNNNIATTIFNSVVPENYTIDFETGPSSLAQFSVTTRPRSRVLVNPTGAYQGQQGMIMDGDAEVLGWSDFDALVNPWGPNSNPERFSQVVLCVKTPDSLATMNLSFYLKQLYHQNFLWTNFRITVNGQPIPFLVNGVPFVPSGNSQALRPPTNFDPAVTNTWQLIQADLTPYIDTANAALQIGFESSVRYTYNYTPTTGTANLIDNIALTSTYLPPLNCTLTPYDPNCPCGQVPPAAGCCPDPNNVNCPPVVNCQVTPYDPACPCGQTPPAAGCCPDPNNVNCPIGTPDLVDRGVIQVYPNPSEGEIAIDLSSLAPDQYTIEIMDVTGKSALREVVQLQSQTSHYLNLAKHPKGIYFVKVSSDSKVYTGKVALQ